MKISAVIPTRNRQVHIRTLLETMRKQTVPFYEIIIVDSSDDNTYREKIVADFMDLNIVWVNTEASVCVQRNKGIRTAKCQWIFLCDDDITLPSDYIEQLIHFVKAQTNCYAVSGLFMQYENNEWVYAYPCKSFAALCWAYIFKLSVWGAVDNLKVTSFAKPFYKFLCRYYRRLGNTITAAGWPVITQLEGPYFTTSTYSLGSSLVRKELLEQSPFDEVLDPSGYGDNYGVAMGFPDDTCIYVTHQTKSYNGKAQENRVDNSVAYFRRSLALHYFLRTKKQFSFSNRLWFIWSLLGNQILFLIKRRAKMAEANLRAISLILGAKNPYVLGAKDGKRIIKPSV